MNEKAERRYDLDWLRVLAILLLHFFHSGMPYVKWDWHVKNAEFSSTFEEAMFFLHQWRMPLLFFISGAGTRFALGVRTSGEYAAERIQRLLVPVIFGILVIVPPQVYFERLSQGQAYTSFWQFYPHVFNGPYPQGNLSWHHLRFVVYLLVYSLLALPLLQYWRSDSGRQQIGRWAELFSKSGALLILGIPLAAVQVALRPRWPGFQNLISDWANFVFYFTMFLYGYLVCCDERFWQSIERHRRTALKLGCAALAAFCCIRWNGWGPKRGYSTAYALYMVLSGFHTWFWVLAAVGYGRRYLNRNHRLLAYANEGIYPFYILHQTLIVVVAFYVVQTSDELWVKYVFTAGASFLATLAIYDFLVKPFAVTRFLFGMKPKRSPWKQP